ncbi:hypothetical protein [Streptomyces sp. NPDC093970]|uniref:hypothetical protein n=1 Tax=Streptomyces sp. NPDC093970 TaxID=3155076 RepID=UPI003421AE2F
MSIKGVSGPLVSGFRLGFDEVVRPPSLERRTSNEVRGIAVPACPAPGNGETMKMIKAIVKKFKQDEDLATNAWPYHVI